MTSPDPVVHVGMSSGTATPDDECELEPELVLPSPLVLLVGLASLAWQLTLPRTTWLSRRPLIWSQLNVLELVSTLKAPSTCLMVLLKSTLKNRERKKS